MLSLTESPPTHLGSQPFGPDPNAIACSPTCLKPPTLISSERRCIAALMADHHAAEPPTDLVWDAAQQRILLSRVSKAPLPSGIDCSICAKRGYLHLTIPKERVDIAPEVWSNTTTYTFNTGIAKHTFCSKCGVQAIYQPRSNPDCYSINVRCLELGNIKVPLYHYDGQNHTGALNVI